MRHAMLALLVLAMAACTPASRSGGVKPGALDAMAANATTPADHEALAARYDQEAAEARATAAQHRRMGQTYRVYWGGKGGLGASAMPQHCESIARTFDEQAQLYAAMAAAERELAQVTK